MDPRSSRGSISSGVWFHPCGESAPLSIGYPPAVMNKPCLVSSPDPRAAEGALSLFAFGHPSDPRTFSGYSCNLARAMALRGLLRSEYSIKDLRASDVLTGAFRGSMANGRLTPKINREWMWSRRGNARLASRLHRRISAGLDRGPFLQIGTLVSLPEALGAHFVLTDMTIPQACESGYFDVAGMSDRAQREALEVQGKVLENARVVFTLSEWTRRSVIEDFGIHAEQVQVVFAGSNLVIPGDLVQQRNPREILFVGIDWQRKGGDVLLEAFRLLRGRFPDVTLTIVGCRPPVDEPGIRTEGFLDRRIPADAEKLARCYLRAGCFCLPSLFDPFPNAIIEAAAVGLPSVAIDNGSRREAIIDGKTGCLASEATPLAVADALSRVLENEEQRQAFGLAAKIHAERHFTWDRVIDKITRTIKEATS